MGRQSSRFAVGDRLPETLARSRPPPSEAIRVRVQVRHRHQAALARIVPGPNDMAAIAFEEPVRAVAPGQAAVFYDAADDNEVIGGGWLLEGIP